MSDASTKPEKERLQADAQHMVPPCPHGMYYTVENGDTMFLIAQRFGVCLDQLIAANPQVKDPNLIYPGQVLCIPKKKVEPVPDGVPCPEGFIYVVKPGDTLSSIADMFSTTVKQLLAANPHIKDPKFIFPGQRICIPVMPPVMLRCRCFCMLPTCHCPGAMGMGRFDMERQELVVVARGLPNPEHFGMDRMVMMAGYDGCDEFQTIDMMPVSYDMMMCHHRMGFDMGRDPVFLIAAARRFPFAFGPVFLIAVVRF